MTVKRKPQYGTHIQYTIHSIAMEERIRERLVKAKKNRKTITIEADMSEKRAAVLLPIYKKEEEGEYYIVLTKRTANVEHHKGQISFPGGAYEKKDGNLKNTALRESEEEIGIKPEDVKILGELDDVKTFTSNYVITPFVAFIPQSYKYKKNDSEVEEVIEMPVSALFDERNAREDHWVYGKHVIWGATAMILRQFIEYLL